MKRPLVDLISPPFSGHLHPLLGIGRRLARDVSVRVISTPAAAGRTRAAGLDPVTLLHGTDDVIRAITEPDVLIRHNPLRLNQQFRSTLGVMAQLLNELRTLYRQNVPDLVIADFTLPAAGYLALELGIPWWTSLPSACTLETPDGPPPNLGGLLPRPGALGRVRDAIGRGMVRTFKRTVVRLHRRALTDLGLPGPYRADGTEAAYSPECILALGLRELEFARTFSSVVRFTGPVRYSPPVPIDPPQFEPGRRHVLISIGTHLRSQKDRVADAAEDAARQFPKIEFHFTDGRPDAPRHPRQGNFQRLAYIDYALLPQYDLVVHHGGSGIMNETLAAGLPAIVFPLDYDQFDNAARLCAAGLAVRLYSLHELPQMITRALGDGTSVDSRRRFRSLLHDGSPEETIARLVHQRLGVTDHRSNTVLTAVS